MLQMMVPLNWSERLGVLRTGRNTYSVLSGAMNLSVAVCLPPPAPWSKAPVEGTRSRTGTLIGVVQRSRYRSPSRAAETAGCEPLPAAMTTPSLGRRWHGLRRSAPRRRHRQQCAKQRKNPMRQSHPRMRVTTLKTIGLDLNAFSVPRKRGPGLIVNLAGRRRARA